MAAEYRDFRGNQSMIKQPTNHKMLASVELSMEEIQVVKENGEKEKFRPQKVNRALRRSGLSSREADSILEELEPMLYDGITTKKIYHMVYGLVRDKRPEVTHKYNLKRALQMLGPAGYYFEDYTSKFMQCIGYKTETRQRLTGRCVDHEIDVIASKGSNKFMIECKFHNEPGTRCRIQTALYVYARFLDLKEYRFTKPWLVTNTKFSADVVSYAECMGIPLLGWRYPLKESLETLIDRKKCYPVSVIDMSQHTLAMLLKRGIVTVQDVPESPQSLVNFTGISLANARKIVEGADYAR